MGLACKELLVRPMFGTLVDRFKATRFQAKSKWSRLLFLFDACLVREIMWQAGTESAGR